MMNGSWQHLADVDPTKANVARVYDYWLGGTTNLVADREVGQRMATLDPWIPAACRANRAFLGRVVEYLAVECRVRQFIDIGSGEWDMLEPGLVYVPLWRPDSQADVPRHPERFWFLAGAARKPGLPPPGRADLSGAGLGGG
jgi:S-adenosyl methyltransferase